MSEIWNSKCIRNPLINFAFINKLNFEMCDLDIFMSKQCIPTDFIIWELFWMYFNWRKGIKFLIEFCLFLSRCLGLSRVWKDGVTNPKDDYDRYEYERYMNKSGAIWQKFYITRNEDIVVTVAFTRHLYNFPRISTLSGTFDGCREVVHMNLFKK